MITLDYRDAHPGTKDRRRAAGQDAEQQMAHYLNRAFEQSDDVALLHGLRLVDETRTDVDGGPVVAQMDHLVLHRHGAFIVESKSCNGSVRITASGSDRDEWAIRSGSRKYTGMKSPLLQAGRQGEVLRDVLMRHDKEVLGKRMLRQRSFERMPLQLVVAISDGGMIEYKGRWKPRQEPFADSVEKADQVVEFVREQLKLHTDNAKLIGSDMKSEYGWWASKPEEVIRTARLLYSLHTPLVRAQIHAAPPTEEPTAPAPTRPKKAKAVAASDGSPVCRSCGQSDQLDGKSGRYGPYWHCSACETNTSMPRLCSACGADDSSVVRVRKRGSEFVRECGSCSVSEVVWRILEA